MKKIFYASFLLFLASATISRAQVGIGTTTPNNKAILDLVSNNKGLLVPRLTTTERNAMALVTADNGMIIYNTTVNKFQFWDGGAWADVGGGGTDNLGNHSTTQNIRLNSHYLSADGDNEGLNITSSGRVRFNTNAATTGIYHFNDHIGVKGIISLFDTISTADFAYDGGTNGVFVFNNTGIGTGSTKFNTTAVSNALVIANNTGNIGIGTATPNTPLEIARDYASTNIGENLLTLSRTTSGTSAVNIGGRILYKVENAAGTLVDAASISTNLTNVGSGTETSDIYFNVVNAGSLQNRMYLGGTGQVGLVGTPSSDNPNLSFGRSTAISGTESASMTFRGDALNHMGLSYVPNSISSSSRLSIAAGANANPGNMTQLVSFMGSGRVGIGTTNPSALLSVGASNQFQVNTAGNILRINGINTNFPAAQGAAGTFLSNDGAGNFSWTTPSGDNLGSHLASQNIRLNNFYLSGDGGNEGIYVNSTGQVGIGTTTPNGELQLANTLSNRKFVLYEVANNDHEVVSLGVNGGVFRYQLPATSNEHAFYAGTSATTSNTLFRIMGNGRVKVPAGSILDFDNAVSNKRLVLFEAANNDHEFNGLGISAGTIRYQAAATSNDHTFFAATSASSSTELMRIKGNGTVQIGASGQFQVDNVGNITKINNITTNFPSAQGTANTFLRNDGGGNLTWANPSANSWGITGNSGMVDGTNFIGTTTAVPLNFRVGNVKAGRIEIGGNANTFFGHESGFNNSGGINNLALGYRSLYQNVTGNNNVALGSLSLTNSTSSNNTAIGYQALRDNNSGANNTAMGLNALRGNLTGSSNVAIGEWSLSTSTDGEANTVTGSNAMRNFSTGSYNTAYGALALRGTAATGSNNSAMGYQALMGNTSGGDNTAHGWSALFANNSGQQNTAVGYNTLGSNTTGSSNTAIGANANVGSGNLTNATAVGANATVDISNAIVLGNNTVNVGIGTSSPAARLAIGANSEFRINNAGNIIRVNNIPAIFPSTQGTAGSVLTNDGAGNLTWGGVATNYWGLTGNAGTNASNFIGTTDSNPLRFRVNNTPAGRIDHAAANTFLGISSGTNATGGNNTAFGTNALAAVTSGFQNTAVGSSALVSNNGSNNVAIGFGTLGLNSSGSNNVGIGNSTLSNNTTSSNNTAFGFQALVNNTAGQNTALGTNAGNANTVGTANLFLGYEADAGSNNLSNATAIGANATVNTSNAIVLGSGANVGIGASSPAKLTGANRYLTVAGTEIGATNGTASLELVGNVGATNAMASKVDFLGIVVGSNDIIQRARIEARSGNGATGAGQLAFYTNSGGSASSIFERMRIRESGEVGIGTAGVVSSLLSIGASNQFQVNTTGNLIRVNNVPYTWPAANVGGVLSNDGAGALNWSALPSGADAWTRVSPNIYTTTLSDNVGIGIATAAHPLQINESGQNPYIHFTDDVTGTTSADGLILGTNGAGSMYLVNQETDYDFNIGVSGTSNLMRFWGSAAATNRRVGIDNAATPAAVNGLFNVRSALPTTTTDYATFINNISTNTTTDGISKFGLYINSTGTFTGLAGTATNNYGLYVNTPAGADNNYAAIFAGGNVGIGIAAPTERLEVNGGIEIPAANDYKYAAAKTNYYSVAASSFTSNFETGYSMGRNVDANGATTATYFFNGNTTQIGYATAPVNLPNGAVVTAVDAYLLNNDATVTNVPRIVMVRRTLNSTSSTLMTTCSAPTLSGSVQTINDNTVIGATIDNSLYAYALVFSADQASNLQQTYGVRITYTVTKVD